MTQLWTTLRCNDARQINQLLHPSLEQDDKRRRDLVLVVVYLVSSRGRAWRGCVGAAPQPCDAQPPAVSVHRETATPSLRLSGPSRMPPQSLHGYAAYFGTSPHDTRGFGRLQGLPLTRSPESH